MSRFLRKFDVFSGLTDGDVEILERVMVVEDRRSGHVFVREGDRATAVTASMFLIVEGSVEVVAKAPMGGFGIRRTMGPGELFGLVAFVAASDRTATVRAAGSVKTARLDRRTFEALYHSDAGVHARFQYVVAQQLARDIRNTRNLLATAITTGNVEPVAARFS